MTIKRNNSKAASALNYKKPAFWIIVAAFVTCVVVAVYFMTNSKDNESDLSFLNYENACSIVADMTDIDTVFYPPTNKNEDGKISIGYVNGGELAKYLDLVSWQKWKAPHEGLSSPGSIEFCIRDDYRITIYQKPRWAMVTYGDEVRYYKTHGGDYDEAVKLFHAKFYNAQKDDTGIIVTSGKNEIPVVVFPAGTPISDVKDSVFWIDIDPRPDDFVPFTIYCDGYEQYGQYSIYDAETMEALKFFLPSGLSPQTYLFQNAECEHSYIVTLLSNDVDLLCFGARIENATDLTFDASSSEIDILREKYPEYFDLSTGKGLEVYVWQMGPDSFSFGVLSGTNRGTTNQELWNLKGVSADQMKAILSTYDIDEDRVLIIPFQHPLSSYIGEYWVMQNGENQNSVTARQQNYIDSIRGMLFDYE